MSDNNDNDTDEENDNKHKSKPFSRKCLKIQTWNSAIWCNQNQENANKTHRNSFWNKNN